jgi:hypothetical protein
VIDITLRLPDREAAALAEMARRFQFGDAQFLLRDSRNASVDSLCEAVSRMNDALTAAGIGRGGPPLRATPEAAVGGNPMVMGETGARISIAFTIEKAELAKHRRFLQALLAASAP